MTSNEISFALLKSIIVEDVDTYEVRLKINFLGNWVLGFVGNSLAQKLNKAQTKRVKIKRRAVFSRDLVLLTRASTGVISTLYYYLSFIYYTS